MRSVFQIVRHLLRGQVLLLGGSGHLVRKPGEIFGLG